MIISKNTYNNIHFELRKSNNISFYNYINKYKYNDIIKIFSLQNEYHKDSSKVQYI